MSGESYIKRPEDLVTSYEQTRAGFLKIALEKNRQATPFVEEAKALKTRALKASQPSDLLHMNDIKPALLAAAGLSDKSLNHLTANNQEQAIFNLIENFLSPAGEDFVDELIFRFLLTRGDSLGGKMRNLAGIIAEQQLIRTIVATLSVQGKDFRWYSSNSRKWLYGDGTDPDIETQARGLSWLTNTLERTLIFNLTLPGIRKNVDLCLFNGSSKSLKRGRNKQSIHYDQSTYLALGELKGGIDPAGADEHWKTANSALDRIRKSFGADGFKPHLFYIGAAIEKSMAEEIFSQLNSGNLSVAANLTNENQMFELCDWLVKL